MSSNSSADNLRKRLVKIDDQVRTLDPGDFAERYRLRSEADVLRRQLGDLATDEEKAILDEWSTRAGRKNSHTEDEELERAKAAIVSPNEWVAWDDSCIPF